MPEVFLLGTFFWVFFWAKLSSVKPFLPRTSLRLEQVSVGQMLAFSNIPNGTRSITEAKKPFTRLPLEDRLSTSRGQTDYL